MRKFFQLIFFFSVVFSFSQERKKIDSLLSFVKRSKPDTALALAFVNLSSGFSGIRQDSSAYFAKKAQQLSMQLGFKKGLALAYNARGMNFQAAGQYDSALRYYERALAIKTAGALEETYKLLAELYKKKKDFKKSFEYLNEYSVLKDSLLDEKNSRSMAEMQSRFDTEKKEREIALLMKDKKIQDLNISEQQANIRKQRIVLFISVGGVLMVVALVFFILKGYMDKKKANNLLEEKNDAILYQKKILEEKNVLVTDSIEYAKGIQETILPTVSEIKKYMPECFVLYRPKDIVAGDFCWLKTNADSVFFAVADCTGHGVPGAFMSMHSYYLLERIMKENNFSHPSQLLDELNRQMVDTLHQASENASAKYGIDMSLVKIEGGAIEFAGARNPLVICSENKLEEIKADRIYIGGAKEKFANNALYPKKGSMLYMFTDGYADQKGGKEGKKFFATTLRELLKEISHLPVEEQKAKLEKTFEEWKGNTEQIDDVLITGIRL